MSSGTVERDVSQPREFWGLYQIWRRHCEYYAGIVPMQMFSRLRSLLQYFYLCPHSGKTVNVFLHGSIKRIHQKAPDSQSVFIYTFSEFFGVFFTLKTGKLISTTLNWITLLPSTQGTLWNSLACSSGSYLLWLYINWALVHFLVLWSINFSSLLNILVSCFIIYFPPSDCMLLRLPPSFKHGRCIKSSYLILLMHVQNYRVSPS